MAKIPWKMDMQTYEDYLNIMDQLSNLDANYDSEEYFNLVEELQLLDNFPFNYDPDTDIIVPVLNEPKPVVILNVPD